MNLINQIKTIFYSNKIYHIEAADLKRSGGLDFKLAGANNAEIQNAELILPQLQYYVGVNPIMHLPTNMLVMPGGHAFSNPNHPFLKTLKEGHHSLFQFYSKLAPNNIAQLYGLEEKGELGESLEPWEIPWLLRKRQKPRGEAGLTSEHGLSYYGPISEQKALLEYKRLTKVVKSISKQGYQMHKGTIEGFFMRSGNDFRFFVLGGKHRVAAMVHLGYQTVPVRMRPSYPRVIDRSDAYNWPLVRSGEISVLLAQHIFDAYFN
ncbi:MAG: hypothetical protein IBX48_09635 [Thiomicrospira sp.]|uniref:hypothetical protein n=1 Tax=Thiomicrospira sp. TaxID=935 RepID=UPI001A0E9D24|nr:hypothetical protein [Thiomicrospira sp.]MBE0494587.1 hypothetical protein [Thiomicrospira sp.]